jgi:thiamine biosynthesis lipoprotein
MRVWLKIISVFSLAFASSCAGNFDTSVVQKTVFQGETQGTTYQIIIPEVDVDFTRNDIDGLLSQFDDILSTYIDSSLIGQFNASTDTFSAVDPYGFFEEVYTESREVFELSNGAFDPSVFPLIAGWGFMKNLETPLSATEVDSIISFVSFEKDNLHAVQFSKQTNGTKIKFQKKDPRFKLDFNAIAQGLAVDKVAEFIESKGHADYYVEIGGEIRVKGKNPDGAKWRLGIDKPEASSQVNRTLENVLEVENGSVATSGNYRKFYEVDGKKYAHTLDPKTGFPVQHSLLSATVLTDKCSKADAYATVFMVIGVEKTKEFLKTHPELNLEVYLLFSDSKGKLRRFASDGMKKKLGEI